MGMQNAKPRLKGLKTKINRIYVVNIMYGY